MPRHQPVWKGHEPYPVNATPSPETLKTPHKGVGILRPDGDTAAGADVLAVMVRTDYMPNNDWTTLCQRGRALRAAAGTLTGHAIGAESTPALDPAIVADVIGPSQVTTDDDEEAPLPVFDLPEPLASVVAYLGADLDEGRREFVGTAELIDALDVEPTAFGRQMGELGCRPRPGRITSKDGTNRQARGYLLADIRAAIRALHDAPELDDDPA